MRRVHLQALKLHLVEFIQDGSLNSLPAF
ncbi:hypothetical protein PM8797T_21878 [Gimesia maris DSM 8797]|nr:hypothetical protein PM8797T_21878 [Gimesia maris DSM 8797]